MSPYQLAFRMPGSMPFRAISLKQRRQRPNWRMYALGLPHRLHRLWVRLENFASLRHLAFCRSLATFYHRPA